LLGFAKRNSIHVGYPDGLNSIAHSHANGSRVATDVGPVHGVSVAEENGVGHNAIGQ
jgi:hypothetical protein